MNLEQQATRGNVFYIYAMGYDVHRTQLVLAFYKHPDIPGLARTILFSNIQDYKDIWDEDEPIDEKYIDHLIGLDSYSEGNVTKYVIRTGFREISFYTETPASITELY